MSTTNIEKENLEAHVELCAERYDALETKLDTVEEKVNSIDYLGRDRNYNANWCCRLVIN